jgi:FAD/FMN-containing dehydrogenase
MTQVLFAEFDELRAAMSGPVMVPGEPGYEAARSMFNGVIDRHPAVVARVSGPSDVAAALAFAQANGLEVTVRGGGHSTAGSGVRDGAVMIDLGGLRQVKVDPRARLARAGGGATLADLDAATQEHGLAVPAGLISHTGIGGLTLGGGMGWLTPVAGLSIDNLESLDVVLADGRNVRASASEHPDLFWALRGGGGNFGVVTEFTYRLHEVGPLVAFGMQFFELDQVRDLLHAVRDAVPELPREVVVFVLGINAPPAPFVPQEHWFRPGCALAVVGFGADEAHAGALAHFRSSVPPLFEFAGPIPYVELQKLSDGANEWGTFAYEKSVFVDDLTDDAVAVFDHYLRTKPTPHCEIIIYSLGAGYGDVADDATAFGGSRASRYCPTIVGAASDAEELGVARSWVRSCWDAFLAVSDWGGAYVNGNADPDEAQTRGSYGAKYDRLARIKATYDPRNVFRSQANITPV